MQYSLILLSGPAVSPEVPLSTQKQRLLAEVVAFGEDSGPVRAAMRSGRTPECEPGDKNSVRYRKVCFLCSQNVVDSVFFLELLVLWETDNKSLTSPESFFHVSGLLGRSRTLSSHSTKQNFKICILV